MLPCVLESHFSRLNISSSFHLSSYNSLTRSDCLCCSLLDPPQLAHISLHMQCPNWTDSLMFLRAIGNHLHRNAQVHLHIKMRDLAIISWVKNHTTQSPWMTKVQCSTPMPGYFGGETLLLSLELLHFA